MTTRSELVVLIPGLLCDEAVWENQRATLAATTHCIVPDFGTMRTIESMADHVLAIANTERFSVAGHSMGGRVALEVFRRAPMRVRQLALLDTGYQPIASGVDGQRERDGRARLLEQARTQGMRAMGREWARGMVHRDHVDSQIFERVLDMIARSDSDRFEAQIHALLNRPDAEAVLARIECPTLLLCGRDDQWSPLSRHELMLSRIPSGRLEVVEQAGHMTTMEQPTAVSAALMRWTSTPSN